jgi:phage shock protein PspC (stress-responsive transcriptional regulator)
MTETSSPTPPTPPPPAPPQPGGDAFDRLRALGVARPAEGRWVGGVAAGLARRWNLDPLLVRGIFVALTIVSGIGLLVYGLAWMLLPEDDGSIHVQSALRGDVTAGLVGSGIFILLFLGVGGPDNGPGPVWWGFPGLVILVLVGFGIWAWATYGRTPARPPGTPGHTGSGYPATGAVRPQGAPYTGGPAYGTPPPIGMRPPAAPIPPQPPRPGKARRDPATAASHRITRATLGLAVLAVAAIVIVARTSGEIAGGDTSVLAFAAALGVVATGIVVAGALGRRSGGLAPIGWLLAVLLGVACVVASADLRSGDRLALVGDHDWRPTTAAEAEEDVNLGVGDGTLWLTDERILNGRNAADPVSAMAQLGAGTLTIVVPDDVPVEVVGDIVGGQLIRPDGSRERFDDNGGDDQPEVVRTGPAAAPVIIVDARVGFGEIVIETATSSRSSTPTVTPSVAPTATPSVAQPAPATPAAPAPTATTTPEVNR